MGLRVGIRLITWQHGGVEKLEGLLVAVVFWILGCQLDLVLAVLDIWCSHGQGEVRSR